MANTQRSARQRLYRLLGRGRVFCAEILDREVTTADSVPATMIVSHRPGNRVDAVLKRRRVDVEETDSSVAIGQAGKERCYVTAILIVSGVPERQSIHKHCQRRAIKRDAVRVLCQSPAEVYKCVPRYRPAL